MASTFANKRTHQLAINNDRLQQAKRDLRDADFRDPFTTTTADFLLFPTLRDTIGKPNNPNSLMGVKIFDRNGAPRVPRTTDEFAKNPDIIALAVMARFRSDVATYYLTLSILLISHTPALRVLTQAFPDAKHVHYIREDYSLYEASLSPPNRNGTLDLPVLFDHAKKAAGILARLRTAPGYTHAGSALVVHDYSNILYKCLEETDLRTRKNLRLSALFSRGGTVVDVELKAIYEPQVQRLQANPEIQEYINNLAER